MLLLQNKLGFLVSFFISGTTPIVACFVLADVVLKQKVWSNMEKKDIDRTYLLFSVSSGSGDALPRPVKISGEKDGHQEVIT